MDEYNENVSAMDLVLFNQAMEHITRITRIIFLAGGNALLVGVGGSGKQSLAKLASFILEYNVFRITVATNYTLADLKEDMKILFTKTGVAGDQTVFLLTESQIKSESFLVYINDMLSAGYIPELFAIDEVDEITGKVRAEAKSNGYLDEPNILWDYYLDKVKKNMHVTLCFSPVGPSFRIRARSFPALINNTSIDWFFEWPEEALLSVASRFLSEIELPTDELRENIGKHMSNVHLSIGAKNIEFRERLRRYNYTTPTSYLELINFYKGLLDSKRAKVQDQISRLEQGLQIMDNTNARVNLLKKELDVKMEEVEVEKAKTDELIAVVTKESAIAGEEEATAKIKEDEVNIVANNAKEKKAAADTELAAAIPAMEAAAEAVNCLTPKAI